MNRQTVNCDNDEFPEELNSEFNSYFESLDDYEFAIDAAQRIKTLFPTRNPEPHPASKTYDFDLDTIDTTLDNHSNHKKIILNKDILVYVRSKSKNKVRMHLCKILETIDDIDIKDDKKKILVKRCSDGKEVNVPVSKIRII